jgi:hypothetical protein
MRKLFWWDNIMARNRKNKMITDKTKTDVEKTAEEVLDEVVGTKPDGSPITRRDMLPPEKQTIQTQEHTGEVM